MIGTISIVLCETVFWLQAKLHFAHNVEILVAFIEKKYVEIEVAIFISEPNLHNVSSANSVLEIIAVKNYQIGQENNVFDSQEVRLEETSQETFFSDKLSN